MFDFWQHLALSELIPGTYSGLGTTFNQFISPTNVPPAVGFENSGISMRLAPTGPDWLNGKRQLQASGTENNRSGTPLMTPLLAKQLEDKYDDGNPSFGKIGFLNARDGAGTWLDGCVDYGAVSISTVTTPWDFDLSSTAPNCIMTYLTDF